MIVKPLKKAINSSDYLKILLLFGLIVSLIFTVVLFCKFDSLSVIRDNVILDPMVKQSLGTIKINENENDDKSFNDINEVNVIATESKNALYLEKCNINIKSSYEYEKNEKSLINDDFCDCITGEDETETAACSYLLVGEGKFSCKSNKKHFADNGNTKEKKLIEIFPERIQYIFLSRVNDGICDCHDGSDEYLTGACKKGLLSKKLHIDAKLNSVGGFLRRRRKEDKR
jgi:hypothetical protein